MRPISFIVSYAAAATASIAALQTLGAAGPLTLNGPFVQQFFPRTAAVENAASVPVGILTQQGQLTLTSANNLSAVNFTITGTDAGNNVISEVLAGPNANTVASVKSYSTVTSIVASAAATAVSVGTAAYGATNFLPLDIYSNTQSCGIQVDVLSGAPNYSMTFTDDDPFNPAITKVENPVNASLTAATTSINYQSTQVLRALKFIVNSATGAGANSCRVTITQQSMR